MKQLLLVCAAIIGCGQLSAAPVCVGGTLASYVSLGSGGCMIGSNLLADFQLLGGSAGAAPISPTDVTITPLGGTFDPGIATGINLTADSGSVLETLFTFQISGASYITDSLALSGSSEAVDGAVTGIQNFCSGGAFGPDGVTGCSGLTGALVTVDGAQNQDSTALDSSNLLSVTNDFTVDGGQSGSASAGTLTDRFAAVPEPFTFLLTGVGLTLALGVKLRSGRRNVSSK